MSPFPIHKIPIQLDKDTPTKVAAEELRKELNHIGLHCQETTVASLKKHIDETVRTFPDGKIQGFGIFDYKSYTTCEDFDTSPAIMHLHDFITPLANTNSNWKPRNTAPCMTQLAAIGYPPNFDLLKKSYLGFGGQISSQNYSDNYTTSDAIKNMFQKIAANISSSLIEDLDKEQMEAVFNKIIAPCEPGQDDYDSGIIQRGVYLVKGYDSEHSEAIGILNIEYHLTIKDFKSKKESGRSCNLDITIRSSLYTDEAELDKQYQFLQNHRKHCMFLPHSFPATPEITIYKTLPPEGRDTFIHSLPLEQTQNDRICAVVLCKPDMQNIGCIDNTNSEGSIQYSKTITSGFTFTFGQKISAGFTFSAGTLFTKAEFNIGFEISFSEQWNNSQSETITFTVPKNSKAYLYQGYLYASVLEFNLNTLVYTYREIGSFATNIIKTTPTPIGNSPVIPMADDELVECALWEKAM